MWSRAVVTWSVLLVACSGPDDPVSQLPPLPAVAIDGAEEGMVCAIGEPCDVVARVTLSDGSPATDYEVLWIGLPEGTATERSAPGEERAHLALAAPAIVRPSVRITVRTPPGAPLESSDSTSSMHIVVRVWGGPTTALVASQDPVTLVVGETRAVRAVAYARTGAHSELSSDEVSVAVGDPAIAGVDAAGRVTALAPGETTLTWSAGTQQTSAVLRVVAGTVGAPPAGVAPLPWPVAQTARDPIGPPGHDAEDHIVVDASGATHVVYQVGDRVVVASWTGSGFDFALPSPRWTTTRDPRIAVDARDQLYIATVDGALGTLDVLDRPAATDGAWRRRSLPVALPEARAAGVVTSEYLAPSGDTRPAILAREGGGVWIAYPLIYAFPAGETGSFSPPAPCALVLRLAEVTDAGVTTEDISQVYFTTSGRGCWEDGVRGAPLLLLPPAPGQSRPRLVSRFPTSDDEDDIGAWIWEAIGGQWSHPTSIPATVHPQLPDGRLRYLAVARPDRPGDDHVLFASYVKDPLGPRDFFIWIQAFDQPRQPAAFDIQTTANISGLHAYRAGGATYVGELDMGIAMRLSRYGALAWDDPAPVFTPEKFVNGQNGWGIEVAGAIGTPGQLHFLAGNADGLAVMTRTAPAHEPTPADPETTGMRTSALRRTPVESAPIITPDGTRYVFGGRPDTSFDYVLHADEGNTIAGHTLVSAGPAQAWSELPASTVSYARTYWPVGNDLYTFYGSGSPMLQLYRTTDRAQSFQTVGSELSTGPVTTFGSARVDYISPAGAAYVVTGPGDLLYAPSVTGASPSFTNLGSVRITSEGAFRDLGTEPEDYGVVAIADGAWLVMTEIGAPLERLYVRRYTTAGALVDDKVIGVDAALFDDLRPAGAVLRADGILVMLSWTNTASNSLVAYTVDLTTTTVQRTPVLDGATQPPTPVVRLADNTLVFGTVVEVTPNVFHAVYFKSPDGVTWSGPIELRPDGGAGQHVIGIAAEPAGGFLATVTDNVGLAPQTFSLPVGISPPGLHGASPNALPEDALLVRVASP